MIKKLEVDKNFEKFKKILVQEVFDAPFYKLSFSVENRYRNAHNSETASFVDSLSDEQVNFLDHFLKEAQRNTIFCLMRIFEEREFLKVIITSETGEKLNLIELSSGVVMSDVVVDGGWIDQYSKYVEREFPYTE